MYEIDNACMLVFLVLPVFQLSLPADCVCVRARRIPQRFPMV